MKKIKIGQRNIKTAISVFIALILYVFLYFLDEFIGQEKEGFKGLTAIYTPFFGAIAAAYTSHKDYKSSLKQARIRSVGSIIGGCFGMLLIMLYEFLFITLFPINEHYLYQILQYTFVGFGIILLIYLAVCVKQPDATFISCLTYLSVTISVRNGGMNIVMFATNRILSTLIGVGIALLVNNFRLNYEKNLNILFILGIDSNIDYSDYSLSFTRYKINFLYQKDAKLVLHTKKSGLDEKLFNEVSVNKPLILMDGVCIYDVKTKEYIYSCDFINEVKIKLNKYLLEKNYDTFTYVIHDLKLVCHYKTITNEVSEYYLEKEKKDDNYPFAYADVLDECDVAMYVLFIKKELLNSFLEDLNQLELSKYLKVSFKDTQNENIIKVRIKPLYSSRFDTIKHLKCYDNCDIKVVFVNHPNDLINLNDNDFKICYFNASGDLKEKCDYYVKSNNFNDILKLFSKIYYARNLNRYLETLKKKKSS